MTGTREIRFGPFRLQGRHGPLLRHSRAVHLPPRSLEVLWVLACGRGGTVSRADLLDAVWPGEDVGEAALSYQIKELRRALEDDPDEPRYLLTNRGKGFRLAMDPVALEPIDGAPFVGREAEMNRLLDLQAMSAEGRRQCALVNGEAGIGKSSLLIRFADTLRALPEPPLVLTGCCPEREGQTAAYTPVLGALGQLLEGELRDHSLALLRQEAPAWLLHLPGALTPQEATALRRQISGMNLAQMLGGLSRVLDALARLRPVVLVLEDLHWADRSTVDLVDFIARRPHSARLMLVTSCRNALLVTSQHPFNSTRRGLLAAGLAQDLPLDFLSPAEASQFLVQVLGEDRVTPELARRSFARSTGHPLFLDRIAQYLRDSGTDDAEALPADLRDLISMQFDQLPAADRRLLEAAGAVGFEFAAATLSALLQEPTEALEDRCERLAHLGQFITARGVRRWPDGTASGAFGFRHALYEQVLRERQPPALVAQRSGIIACTLETAYGTGTAQIALELASYFEGASELGKALHYCILAARTALERLAVAEVRNLVGRSLSLLAKLGTSAPPNAEFNIRVIAATAIQAERGYTSGETKLHLERIHSLIAGIHDHALLEPALAMLWLSSHAQSRFLQALDYAGQLADMGRRMGRADLEGLGMAWSATSLIVLGQPQEALQRCRKVLQLAQHRPQSSLGLLTFQGRCPALAAGAMALWYTGRPDAALKRAAAARACVERLGNPYLLCITLASGEALIHLFRRDWAATLAGAEQTIVLCRRYGHKDGLQWSLKQKAVSEYALGRSTQALTDLEELVGLQLRMDNLLTVPMDLCLIAEFRLGRGEAAQARRALDLAWTVVRKRDMRVWEPELLRMEARLLRAGSFSHPPEAERLLNLAIELASSRGVLSLELRAVTELALHASPASRPSSLTRLAETCSRYREGRTSPDWLLAQQVLGPAAIPASLAGA